MLNVTDFEWMKLTPTKTFTRRWALWVPGLTFPGKPAGPLYGASLHQQTGRKSGNKIYLAQYAVEFFGAVPGAMAYQFVFENLDPRQVKPGETNGPYMVTVGPHVFDCDCTAATCRVPVCCHRSMACRAIARGLVDGADGWAGMPEADEQTESVAA